MHKRLEFRDAKSQKFWEITQTGASHTVTYGKIGTDGRSQTKDFANEAAALKDATKLVASKEKKGYTAIDTDGDAATEATAEATASEAAATPKAAAKPAPKPAKPAADEAVRIDDDGNRWVRSEDGTFYLAVIDGKLHAMNKAGKALKSPSKKHKESELGKTLTQMITFRKDHAQTCLRTVESWMLRSLPVPRRVLAAVWPDPVWREYLQHAVVRPADGDDDDFVGFLMDVSEDKLGIVNLDGETEWLDAAQIAVPHPTLLEDLDDWVDLMSELGFKQGLNQLMRQTYVKPSYPAAAKEVNDFSDAVFEPLAIAIRKGQSLGCRVRGGYVVATVWENGKRFDACYWVGAEDPSYEGYGGELIWTDAEGNRLLLNDIGPVAYAEGMRMAHAVYGVRKVEEEKDNG